MKILLKEPEEIENPFSQTERCWYCFRDGKQAVLDASVEVDLDEMLADYINKMSFEPHIPISQFLKEQIGGVT